MTSLAIVGFGVRDLDGVLLAGLATAGISSFESDPESFSSESAGSGVTSLAIVGFGVIDFDGVRLGIATAGMSSSESDPESSEEMTIEGDDCGFAVPMLAA